MSTYVQSGHLDERRRPRRARLGELFPLKIVDVVETGPYSPLAALVKVAPAIFVRDLV